MQKISIITKIKVVILSLFYIFGFLYAFTLGWEGLKDIMLQVKNIFTVAPFAGEEIGVGVFKMLVSINIIGLLAIFMIGSNISPFYARPQRGNSKLPIGRK